MKTVIVIGVFVLIACLQLQANGAVFHGQSEGCKELEEMKNTCHRFECASDMYTVSTCGVRSIECQEGEIADSGEDDLTKEYPDCCAKPVCRKQ